MSCLGGDSISVLYSNIDGIYSPLSSRSLCSMQIYLWRLTNSRKKSQKERTMRERSAVCTWLDRRRLASTILLWCNYTTVVASRRVKMADGCDDEASRKLGAARPVLRGRRCRNDVADSVSASRRRSCQFSVISFRLRPRRRTPTRHSRRTRSADPVGYL